MHWLYTLWYGYAWPSLKGNGPEAVIQTVLYAAAAVLLIPPVRRWLKKEAEQAHAEIKRAEEWAKAEGKKL